MKQWADKLRKVDTGKIGSRRKEVNLAMIAADNHYAGFGPGTVNGWFVRTIVGRSATNTETNPKEETGRRRSTNQVPKGGH